MAAARDCTLKRGCAVDKRGGGRMGGGGGGGGADRCQWTRPSGAEAAGAGAALGA